MRLYKINNIYSVNPNYLPGYPILINKSAKGSGLNFVPIKEFF